MIPISIDKEDRADWLKMQAALDGFRVTNADFAKVITYTLEDLGAKPPPKFKTLRALVAYVENETPPLKLQADIAIEEFRKTLKGQRLKDFNVHYPRRIGIR